VTTLRAKNFLTVYY